MLIVFFFVLAAMLGVFLAIHRVKKIDAKLEVLEAETEGLQAKLDSLLGFNIVDKSVEAELSESLIEAYFEIYIENRREISVANFSSLNTVSEKQFVLRRRSSYVEKEADIDSYLQAC